MMPNGYAHDFVKAVAAPDFEIECKAPEAAEDTSIGLTPQQLSIVRHLLYRGISTGYSTMKKSILQSERQRPRAVDLMKSIYSSHVADPNCGLGEQCPMMMT